MSDLPDQLSFGDVVRDVYDGEVLMIIGATNERDWDVMQMKPAKGELPTEDIIWAEALASDQWELLDE